MKHFNNIYYLFLVLISIYFYCNFTFSNKTSYLQPSSDKNNFYFELNNALNIANITTINPQYRDFIDQFEFTTKHENRYIKVVYSTKKDPYSQTSALQEILKKDKIKDNKVSLIDLSTTHPYATF